MVNELTTIKSNDTNIKERIWNILYKDFDRYLLLRIVHYYSVGQREALYSYTWSSSDIAIIEDFLLNNIMYDINTWPFS